MMKKVFMLVAMLVVAGFANAASVKWNASNLTDANGDALKSTTLGPMTYVATLFDSTGAEIGTSTGTINAMGTVSGTFTNTDLNASYYSQLVVTDKNGATLTTDKAAFATSASATYTINFATGAGFSEVSSKVPASGWQGSVPEPTTGLLIILGMAGLALKRKVA